MKRLPLGIQTFSKLITDNYIYVDKTKQIHQLLTSGGKYYFLSRPRRFGKSLLISTLNELFSGNKELFKNLYIYDKIQWKPYPIIYIDFAKINYESPEILKASLVKWLCWLGETYNVQLDKNSTYKDNFRDLILRLAQKSRVVVLVDEYDKPIIDHVKNKQLAEQFRDILANFYEVIKASDEHVEFTFLTGVSKFSKVSVFSGLNNLRDITLSRDYATLLGYTQEELQHYFADYIPVMSNESGLDTQVLLDKIRQWYNGYSWDGGNFVYNPYSILSLFTEKWFDNFWFSTGTPSFLIDMLSTRKHRIMEFDNLPLGSYSFDSYSIDRLEVIPLLFQTGYLTIKEVYLKDDKRKYRLAYPNIEVRDSLLLRLLREFTQKDMDVENQEIVDYITETLPKTSP